MRLKMKNQANGKASAFVLLEAVMASALAGIVFTALYAGFAWGFANVQFSRDDLRAEQILVKRVETIRLTPFAQITNPTYTPTNFTDYFDPGDQSTGGGGTVYRGTLTAGVPPVGSLPDSYRTNMLLVTVSVSWTNGNQAHSRSLQAYAAQNGMQGYLATGN
jgi:hypothetical protein